MAAATEATAVGVVGALTLAFSQGSLTWKTFSNSLMGATGTSAMIALILMLLLYHYRWGLQDYLEL